jgi:L-lactate utilization protein LutC
VTLSVARFGIAETGTLMIPGGGATPPSMNLLAEHHLVVLDTDHLVDYQEQAWAAYRRETGELPRAVMLVTGPSRTADIEQTLQLGAHGPRNLHVLLVEEAASRSPGPR